jgi:hypothetical protein
VAIEPRTRRLLSFVRTKVSSSALIEREKRREEGHTGISVSHETRFLECTVVEYAGVRAGFGGVVEALHWKRAPRSALNFALPRGERERLT